MFSDGQMSIVLKMTHIEYMLYIFKLTSMYVIYRKSQHFNTCVISDCLYLLPR